MKIKMHGKEEKYLQVLKTIRALIDLYNLVWKKIK